MPKSPERPPLRFGIGSATVVMFAIITLVQGCSDESSPAAANRPNIVLILADDLGYGDVGVYGSDLIATPNIDRLAADGGRLTSFYSSGSNCTPSRAGLLTGRYPIRSGMAHQVIFVDDTHGLPPAEVTIAEMLGSLGYATAVAGKWHLGHLSPYWPTEQGFDEFFGLPYSNNQSPLALYRNTDVVEDPVEQSTLTRRFTDAAIDFISRHKDQPFFVYLAHTAPHIPLHVEPGNRGKSAAGYYGDVVEELDANIGRLTAALETLGLADNTLVIFTSDNGPYPEGSTGGLRGSKGTLWEGGQRVPLIARWPARIAGGSVSDAIAMNIDILPTIAAIAGAELPENVTIDGRSIVAQLNGDSKSPHEVLYFFNDQEIGAVRTQEWKAVFQSRYRGINRWFPEHDVRLLFDMVEDPQETYSLADRETEVWRQMNDHLEVGRTELQSLARHLDD